MENSVRALEAEALNPADKERAELARVLLLSLDEAEDQDTAREWAEEAERRYQELKAGLVKAIPSQQMFEETRARSRVSLDLS